MRVVLDTNVVVSALRFSGVSSKLVPLWQSGAITVLLSRSMLEEYVRALSYPKFQLAEGETKSLIQEELLPHVEVVKGVRRLRVFERDPSDDKFIECAVAGKARIIISGDKDILSIGRHQKILIKSPAQLLSEHRQLR